MSRRDLPPLAWLRAFEASARSLSFTAAARELNVTQAAISKHVRSLELRLGQPLFLRHPRSLSLTPLAEAYLPKVQDALDRLAEGTREVFGPPAGASLTLRSTIAFATNWLSPRLPAFLDAHPEVNLRLLTTVWAEPYDRESIDLDIQYGTGDWPDLRCHRLSFEALVPLCAPAVAARLKHPDDLARERLLHVIGYHEGWGTWLKAAGAGKVDPGGGLNADTTLAVLALAAEGAGVALVRRSLIGGWLRSGALVAPFDLALPVEEGFFLLEPAGGTLPPAAALFRDWLLPVSAPLRAGSDRAPR